MSLAGKIFSMTAKKGDEKRDLNLVEPEGIAAVFDINYAGNQDEYNLLDIYFPKGTDKKLPVIVSIHGGGYVYGTKKTYKFYGMYLAEQGFTVVNFNYHLAPKYKFPTPLRETNQVLEWICQHAKEYHMDLNNVFLVGDSAGAQLCSQYTAIATNEEYAKLFDFNVPTEIKIRAIALNCGMYKNSVEEAKASKDSFTASILTDYFGKNPQKHYEYYERKIDVLGHINACYPPTYIMTSYYDFLRANAEPMYNFLKSKGIETEWKCYGTEEKKYMQHVCHVNMNLEEAKKINSDECEFFKKYMVSSK